METSSKGGFVPLVAIKSANMLNKNKNNCNKKISDCCIKPEAYFDCAPHNHVKACVPDRSNGAYVAYSVAYAKAIVVCENIKQSSLTGTNKQFNSSFSVGFK